MQKTKLLIGLSFIASGATILLPTASIADSSNRVVEEPATGATVTITNEGNCDLLSVTVDSIQSAGVSASVNYDIDQDCRVQNIRGSVLSSVADMKAASGVSSQAESCNWIHSSQTVQDVVNIDIAKQRLNTQRCWNGSSTRMTDWNAESSTSVSWNHPLGSPTLTRFDSSAAASATATTRAKFHTDWLWCNFAAGTQSIQLWNSNITYKDGSYQATFTQDRSCPGTHMATASKANNSPNW